MSEINLHVSPNHIATGSAANLLSALPQCAGRRTLERPPWEIRVSACLETFCFSTYKPLYDIGKGGILSRREPSVGCPSAGLEIVG